MYHIYIGQCDRFVVVGVWYFKFSWRYLHRKFDSVKCELAFRDNGVCSVSNLYWSFWYRERFGDL